MTGKLWIVALPIGNHGDISKRAIKILENVDIIAAEDTRTFNALGTSLCIKTKQVISYHEHNESSIAPKLIEKLKIGQNIAIVSDAGTPGVSDPGFRVVDLALRENLPVSPIPGPSSLVTALSVCPLGGNAFSFLGFAPKAGADRIQFLKNLGELPHKSVFFESPRRLLDTLKESLEHLGNRKVFIAREITKEYESFYFGLLSELIDKFELRPPKGEFVVCIDKPDFSKPSLSNEDLESKIIAALISGERAKTIQKRFQSSSGLSGKELYSLISELKARRD
ncbi:MAG: 16S rRNA (cytidine(1402)-2'-O)-methyltransferase [Bdellovibrionales bacterium]